MDEYRPRRSPARERFIGMFSSPSPSFVAGDELHEDDFLFSSPDAPSLPHDGPRRPGRGVAASGNGSSLSPAQSPISTARAIPATAKPKNAGPAPPYHQSAPVKVPVGPPRKPAMGRWDEFDDDDDEDFRRGDAAMLPPHEMVARASAGGAGPAAPFSMLEGAGRTLKGRDLRRVRDAVLRQTGFLD